MNADFVYIDEYGLLGSNFYWHHRGDKGLSDSDLAKVGLVDERVMVHKDIINILIDIDKEFQKRGYRLYIKEGYRSKALYEVMYQRRIEKFGKAETDRVINMKDMPHSSGRSVDVSLRDEKGVKEIPMRDKADGTDALFVDFYKSHTDKEGKNYQELQLWVRDIMFKYGFKLGTKNEYFHFDYNK